MDIRCSPGKRTVQDELEKALAVLHKSKDRIPVVSSGRTDSGVHAAGPGDSF